MNIMRSKDTVVQNMINHDGIDFGKRPVSETSDVVSMLGRRQMLLVSTKMLE
jgi:hypothetical protein